MMDGNHVITFAFIILSSIFISVSLQADTKCRPFPVMVPIGTDGNKFIVVNQCRGGSNEPGINSNIRCVNSTTKALEGVFYGMDKMQVYNHTSCSMEYVCDHNQDKVANKRLGVCYYHEKWNAEECVCESKNKCHPNSAGSTNKVTSSVGLDVFIIALVVQFIALVSIALIIIRCRKGLKYSSTDSENEIVRFEKQASYCSLNSSEKLTENH